LDVGKSGAVGISKFPTSTVDVSERTLFLFKIWQYISRLLLAYPLGAGDALQVNEFNYRSE
jgi:hypothetical protein